MTPRIIGIAGASGSGKTTVAKKIQAHYTEENCLIISTDNYYKDQSHLKEEARSDVNYDHPQTIDFALLAEHIKALQSGQSIEMPIYDFCTHTRKTKTTTVQPKPYIILEGILTLSAVELASLLELKIFVKADLDYSLLHRIDRDQKERGRDLEGILKQYRETVGPMRREFVEPSKKNAHLVLTNNTPTPNFDMTPVIQFIDNKFHSAIPANDASVQCSSALFTHNKIKLALPVTEQQNTLSPSLHV
jgi:uridine kinase